MIKIREVLISKETYHTTKKGNKVYIRNGKIIVPTSLTIHSTGNLQSTAVNEINWLINPTNNSGASWNICVDEKEAIIAIPFNEIYSSSECCARSIITLKAYLPFVEIII